MNIRRINRNEIDSAVKMIHKVCQESFPLYYPQEFVDGIINDLSIKNIKRRTKECHFYVAVDDNEKIIGSGAISYFWENPKDSIILTIFVDTELQNQGIGRKIIETLERDEIYKNTGKTYVLSSIPGLPVYRHLGYEFEDNKVCMDTQGHFRLVKNSLMKNADCQN
jgi:GNAT superfamily N-acetyltransferase